MSPARALVVAFALTLSPSCAATPRLAALPVAAVQAPDQQAYALLLSYAVALEQAAILARDPDAPIELKRALGELEAIATPVAEALAAAAAAHQRAPADGAARERLRAAASIAQPPIEAFVRAAGPGAER